MRVQLNRANELSIYARKSEEKEKNSKPMMHLYLFVRWLRWKSIGFGSAYAICVFFFLFIVVQLADE